MNNFDEAILKSIVALYIEDDGITRSKTSNFLKNIVGTLHIGTSGTDGLDKFNKRQPHIIITDLIMPDMTGIDLVREIRNKGYDTPVIITSALEDSKIILETIDLGIDKYILKPITLDELSGAILQVSKKLISQETKDYLKHSGLMMDDKKKKEVEKIIRSMVTNYLKQLTGKGPRQVGVSIFNSEVTIKIMDGLTQMEKSLIDYGYNYSMIDFNRNYLYRSTQKEMETHLSDLCNMSICLKSITTHSEKKEDTLIFSFMQ